MINIKQAWNGLSTANVSDALDKLGIEDRCVHMYPLSKSFNIIGPAYTVRMKPPGSKDGIVGDYIDDVPEGSVIAIDNWARNDATVWGDLLTVVAKKRNIEGTVINGVCRDVSKSLKIEYPIFSLGRYMQTGKNRAHFENSNLPIKLGDVKVNPGDIIIGDADGVVIVPLERAETVLATTIEIIHAEDQIVKAVESGMRLDEARKRYNYFHLQSA